MMRRVTMIWLVVLGLSAQALAQGYDTLRVATYNLLNYPANASTRNPEFRKILRAIHPDILILQELTSSSGLVQFRDSVLNKVYPGSYGSAPWVDSWDTENGMCYRTARVSFISPQTVLSTVGRDINGYRLRPAGVSVDSLDIQIYSAHLRASQGNEDLRGQEAGVLRNHLNSLPDGGFFAAGGDFNLYTSGSNEPAWDTLTGSDPDNSGRLYDPINTPGNWHDGSSFVAVHTQSTRDGDLGDGGATGGMDDRFDFLLLSYNYETAPGWRYVPGSYTEYGNDGLHFNQSINDPANQAVPDSIADALYTVSDHLPVFLDIYRQTGATITVLAPNGSEVWKIDSMYNITWSSQSLSGTVTVAVNRSYPSGTWDTLTTGTANDGTQPWTVSGPASTTARIRVSSDAQPTVSDESNANFTIQGPIYLMLLTPNGGEKWNIGQPGPITWTSSGITGNVRIELNRTYPTGNWDILYGSAINDGNENWTVTSPATVQARMRIWSINAPTVGDTSDANFEIRLSAPPVITHDRHGDTVPDTVRFTAIVTDDYSGVSAKLFYRASGASLFDSLTMTATGNPSEFTALATLSFGLWEYFIRATDSHSQTAQTDTFELVVSEMCGGEIRYDDETAEAYHWGSPDGFWWAVRFTPPSVPFVLCEAEVGVAAFHPDTAHTPICVRVMDANGPGGAPGSVIREVTRGSVGNVIGGLGTPGTYFATVVLHDEESDALTLSEDFYIAVSNTDSAGEGFAMDTSSANAGRSYVYDPCEGAWFIEDGVQPTSRDGNRMIRVHGWAAGPNELVIVPSGSDISLYWNETGAAYYHLYRSSDAVFTSPVFLGTTTDTTFVDVGAVGAGAIRFYHVMSSSAP